MRGMTGVDVPRRVRAASLFTWLLVPAGLLLAADGAWELRWWGSDSAKRLLALLASIKSQFGTEPPVLLRGHGGAAALLVLGLIVLGVGLLAPMISRGRRWARTTAILLGLGTLALGLAFIGGDLSDPNDLAAYLANLHQGIADQQIPRVEALIYPGWYNWVEDIAQGLQVIASAAAVAALSWSVMTDGDYFTSKQAEQAGRDEWDDAITRLHKRTVGGND